MSAPSFDGPFRRDARVEATAELAPMPVAARVLGRITFPGILAPAYFAVLGLTTIALGVGLGVLMPALVTGVGLVALAILFEKQYRDARRYFAAEGSIGRALFTSDAIVLEGALHRIAWSYDAITSVTAHDGYVALILRHHHPIVLRADGAEGSSLATWIRARATHLSNAPFPRRVMLGVLALYVTLAAAIVIVLPRLVAP